MPEDSAQLGASGDSGRRDIPRAESRTAAFRGAAARRSARACQWPDGTALSLLIAQRRLWVAGALAAFAVLLLFFVVSRVSTRKPPPIVSTPRQGTLEITTSPPGAAVSVNGKPIGTATGGPAGPVRCRIRRDRSQTTRLPDIQKDNRSGPWEQASGSIAAGTDTCSEAPAAHGRPRCDRQ